ncbi:MAG: hypothetical protein QXF12_07560 [Candidatus Aenigmatarchaeota archaeon]
MSKNIRVEIVDYDDNSVSMTFSGQLSVNRLYRNVKGRTKPYIQAKHVVYNYMNKKYKHIIDHDFNRYEKYYCEYIFIFNNKRPRDVSNYIKFFEDLVFRLMIKDDDNKVYKINIVKDIYREISYNYVIVRWTEYNEDLILKDKSLQNRLESLKLSHYSKDNKNR